MKFSPSFAGESKKKRANELARCLVLHFAYSLKIYSEAVSAPPIKYRSQSLEIKYG
jgi:hypothetical protein